MKQFILLPVILVLLFIPSVTAIGLEYYGIEDSIKGDMSIATSITLKFDNTINHLDYRLGYKIENLTATATFDDINCETIVLEEGSLISCDFSGMTKEKNHMELKFETNEGIEKVGDEYKFAVNYGINLPINRSYVLVKLPENAVLSRETVNMSFYPRDAAILTDGKHIMVAWEGNNLKMGDDLQFMVLYTLPFLDKGLQNVMIISITIIVILAMIIIVLYSRRNKSEMKIVNDKFSMLNKDEKVIVNILKERDGKAYQKVLVRESNFSKAKVSRLVKSLKERDVIDIEPVSGRENQIVIKKIQKPEEE